MKSTGNPDPRDLQYNIIGFLVSVALLLAVIFADYGEKPVFQLARQFQESDLGGLSADLVVLTFLFLHYVRVYLGFMFIDGDSSFLAALNTYTEAEREVFRRTVNWIKLLNFLSLSVFPFAAQRDDALPAVLVLAFQAMLLLFFDWRFRQVLFERDKDRNANKFIFVGDVATVMMIVAVCTPRAGVDEPLTGGLFVPVLFGAIAAVFLGELWAHYYRALSHGLTSLFRG